ncbi:MAG: hypothetical protein ACRCZV_13405, partial [Sediminibacterium sp.]
MTKYISLQTNNCSYMNVEANSQEDWMKLLVSDMRQQFEKIKLGGGRKSIEKQRERNKLTARERISFLCDPDTPFIEIGPFAGYQMYEEEGGCASGGTVA